MLRRKYNYTLRDIEEKLPRKSWWAIVFILPIARRVSLFLINYTEIKPNSVTLFSFFLALLCSLCFLRGTHFYLIAGGIFFELNYILDCVDGSIAQVKNLETPLGSYLDWEGDRIKIFLLAFCLSYGQWHNRGSTLPFMLCLLYLGINNLLLLTRQMQEKIIEALNLNEVKAGVDLIKNKKNKSGLLFKWIAFTESKNYMPYYHDIETDALVFFIGPLLNRITLCLSIGVVLLFILVCAINIIFIWWLKNKSFR